MAKKKREGKRGENPRNLQSLSLVMDAKFPSFCRFPLLPLASISSSSSAPSKQPVIDCDGEREAYREGSLRWLLCTHCGLLKRKGAIFAVSGTRIALESSIVLSEEKSNSWKLSIFRKGRILSRTACGKRLPMPSYLLFLSVFSLLIPYSTQLQSSQAWSLLRIQRLLNYPPFLSNWNNYSDFCYAEPNPYVTVVCYENSVTQLQISGNGSSRPLPRTFSINSFFTTLTRLPNLKVLSLTSLGLWGPLPAKISRLSSLEIVNMSSNFLYGVIPPQVSHLKNLQTLILDHNMFSGQFPEWLSSLSLLAVVSLKNNTLNGPLPDSVKSLEFLRVLDLSLNSFSGQLPDLSGLKNIQVLDLEGNYFGPQFPKLGKKVETLVLRKNRFTGGLPSDLSSYYMLERLDISLNRFVGPFMPALLSLPSIQYLDIAGNRFTGMFFQNMSCNDKLEYVDLSSNLLTGSLPECLVSNSKNRVVLYSANCLASKEKSQHPNSFCLNQALAVGILPHNQKKKASVHKTAIAISVVAVVVGATLLLGVLTVFLSRRANARKAMKRPPRRLIEHASSGYPSKMLADARYISQAMKLGALGVPSYRSFSLEELEAATNNFESSSFMGEGPHGQMYRGRLNDGSLIAIRCLKLKRSHSSENFNRHIELISKLRYRHLVSALGHCFEYYLDDSTVSRLFLIFEYVSNGTLRSNISGVGGQKLTWTQRISAAIGVAKGIQFLHAGIIPGLFGNDLKATNILLDQNLVAKISSYNLPVLTENMKNEVVGGVSLKGSKEHGGRSLHGDKVDIYDFGVILLEIITGRPITLHIDVEMMKNQLQANMTADGAARKMSMVDPAVSKACCKESLKTVIEVCARCLSKEPTERPSVEDVLWNLQFAAQVQDAWRGDSHSSEGSPITI